METIPPSMTDEQLIRLCAASVGVGKVYGWDTANLFLRAKGSNGVLVTEKYVDYDPLNDDEQAMELVKEFRLSIDAPAGHRDSEWVVSEVKNTGAQVGNRNLNRAIVECVAMMKGDSSSKK
jgi:hypothetical protein